MSSTDPLFIRTSQKSADLLASGNQELCVPLWQDYLEANANCSEGYFQLGMIYRTVGGYPIREIDCLENACKLDASQDRYWLELASSLQLAERYSEAINACNIAAEIEPSNVDVYQRRGLIYYFARNLEKSHSDFERVLQIDSTNGFARLRIAINYCEQNKLSLASEILRTYVLERESYNETAESVSFRRLSSLAHVEFIAKLGESGDLPRLDRAIADALTTEVIPDDFLTVFFLAKDYLGMGRAIQFFLIASENELIHSGDTGFACAQQAASAGMIGQAIDILELTLCAHPNHLKCMLELGWYLFLQDAPENAERYLRKAIEIDEKDARGFGLLAWVLSDERMRDEQRAEALEIAKKMLPLDGYPDHKKLKVLARCQTSVGMIPEAKSTLGQLRQIAPEEDVSGITSMSNWSRS